MGRQGLHFVVTVLARVLAGLGSGSPADSEVTLNAVRRLPSPRQRRAAFLLLISWEQREVRARTAAGKLDGLGLWTSRGPCRGLLVTRGRLPEETWRGLTGLPHLPVLLGGGALARLIVTHEHEVDH